MVFLILFIFTLHKNISFITFFNIIFNEFSTTNRIPYVSESNCKFFLINSKFSTNFIVIVMINHKYKITKISIYFEYKENIQKSLYKSVDYLHN